MRTYTASKVLEVAKTDFKTCGFLIKFLHYYSSYCGIQGSLRRCQPAAALPSASSTCSETCTRYQFTRVPIPLQDMYVYILMHMHLIFDRLLSCCHCLCLSLSLSISRAPSRHMYTCMDVRLHACSVHMYACVCVHCVRVYIYTHTYIHRCAHLNLHLCMCVCTDACACSSNRLFFACLLSGYAHITARTYGCIWPLIRQMQRHWPTVLQLQMSSFLVSFQYIDEIYPTRGKSCLHWVHVCPCIYILVRVLYIYIYVHTHTCSVYTHTYAPGHTYVD